MSQYIEQELKAYGVARVLVKLKAGTGAAAADSPDVSGFFRSAETSRASTMASALTLARGAGGARSVNIKTPPAVLEFPHLGIAMGTVDAEGLAGLRKSQKVKEVFGAPIFSLIRPKSVTAAAKPRTRVTWGIDFLEADKLWEQGFTGRGVLIGHLDTGADGKHETLKEAIKHFAEFDEMGREVRPAPAAYDTDDHGTHTAATIAGRAVVTGKSKRRIHVGVAPEADLACGIVIEGGDVVARVLAGMNWAVGKKVRVLSMSLGLRGFYDDFEPVTQILREKGVLPVFAIGNEGPATSRSPGNYAEVLSVGAHDRNSAIADFSSSDRFNRPDDPLVPDLAGPGVDIISAKPGGGYQSMDGTSMATPHIAGLAALLLSARPNATPDEIETAIYVSCERSPGMPEELANRGAPNAVRALRHLMG